MFIFTSKVNSHSTWVATHFAFVYFVALNYLPHIRMRFKDTLYDSFYTGNFDIYYRFKHHIMQCNFHIITKKIVLVPRNNNIPHKTSFIYSIQQQHVPFVISHDI